MRWRVCGRFIVGLCCALTAVLAFGQSLSKVSVTPASVIGGASATGTVTLTKAAGTGGLAVSLTSSNANATVPGSVTVSSGAKTASFSVQTIPVAATATATIKGVLGSSSASANLTIAAPKLKSLVFAPSSVAGGNFVNGTLSLTGPSAGVTATMTASSPAWGGPSSVTIASGASSARFTCQTTPVSATIAVKVTAKAYGASVVGALTIKPSALADIELNPSTMGAGGPFGGTVFLTGPAPSGGAKVLLSSNSKSATVPASVVIPAGATSQVFTGTTSAVSKQVLAKITATFASKSVSATLTLVPMALASLSLNPASLAGGDIATGAVFLNGPAPLGGWAVNLFSSDPSAIVPGNVVIPSGQTSAQFQITTVAVSKATSATITAKCSANSVQNSLTVTPATLLSLVINPSTVIGGSGATGRINLDGQAPTGGLTINLSCSDPSAMVPPSVAVSYGNSTATFPITTIGVASDRSVSITASLAGNQISATLTVLAPVLTSFSVAPVTVVGGSSATGAIGLSSAAPSGGMPVSIVSNSTAIFAPATVMVPQGAQTATFNIQTQAVAVSVTGQLTASLAKVSLNAPLAVQAPTLVSFTLNPTTVIGGVNSTGTITVSSNAPFTGLPISLTSDQSSVTVPSSVSIPAGGTQATFNVTTKQITSQIAAHVTATLNGSSLTALLTVLDISLVSVTLNPATLIGGQTSVGTITLDRASPNSPITVGLNSNQSSVIVPASVDVAAGSTTATFTVTTSIIENPTTALITATLVNTSVKATLTIKGTKLVSFTLSTYAVVGGQSCVGTVTISQAAPSAGVPVGIASSSASATVPDSVTITSGAKSANFPIQTAQLTVTDKPSITATLMTTSISQILVVQGTMLSKIVLNPIVVVGGSSTTGSALLNGPAPSGGMQIVLQSNINYASVPASIIVPAGLSTASFTINTDPLSPTTYATITGTDPYSNSASATLGINVHPGLAHSAWPKALQGLTNGGRGIGSGALGTSVWNYLADGAPYNLAVAPNGSVYYGTWTGFVEARNPDGTKQWSYQTGNRVNARPVVAPDGTIYVGSTDGYLYAFDPAGNLKRSYLAGSSISFAVLLGSDGTIYFGSDDGKFHALNPDMTVQWTVSISKSLLGWPALGGDGSIYFQAADGVMYALNPDGTIKWKNAIGGGQNTPPVISPNGTVITTVHAQSVDSLVALDPESGVVKWTFSRAHAANVSILSGPAVGADGTTYVVCQDQNAYALNSDGTLKWSRPIGDNPLTPPVVLPNGNVFIASNTTLFTYDPSGTQTWTFSVSSQLLWAVAGTDGTIYFTDATNQFLTAISASGALLWRPRVSWFFEWSPVIGIDGTLYAGDDSGQLSALNPNGSVKWVYSTGSSIQSGIAIDTSGTLYFGTRDGTIWALLPDGTKKWSFQTGTIILSSPPTIDNNGTIYFPAIRGLVAMNADGTQKWIFPGDYNSAPAIASDGTIYASTGYYLNAINPDGTLKWSFATNSGFGLENRDPYEPAIGSDGTIYVPAHTKFYALNPDGSVKWSFDIGAGFAENPAIGADGTIYFGTANGANLIYALSPAGTEIWSYQSPQLPITPSILSDGSEVFMDTETVYMLNHNGSLLWKKLIRGIGPWMAPSIGPDGTLYLPGYGIFAIK